jgi:hypothetical protein
MDDDYDDDDDVGECTHVDEPDRDPNFSSSSSSSSIKKREPRHTVTIEQ